MPKENVPTQIIQVATQGVATNAMAQYQQQQTQQQRDGSGIYPAPLPKTQESLLVHVPNYTVTPKHPPNEALLWNRCIKHLSLKKQSTLEPNRVQSSNVLAPQTQYHQGRN